MSQCHTNNTSFFVSNLNKDVTEELLQNIFQRFGDVVSVQIVRYPKLYAIVKFQTDFYAQKAMENLNSKIIMGQRCIINWENEFEANQLPNVHSNISLGFAVQSKESLKPSKKDSKQKQRYIPNETLQSSDHEFDKCDFQTPSRSRIYLLNEVKSLFKIHTENMIAKLTEMCETFEDGRLQFIIDNENLVQTKMDDTFFSLKKEFKLVDGKIYQDYRLPQNNTDNCHPGKEERYTSSNTSESENEDSDTSTDKSDKSKDYKLLEAKQILCDKIQVLVYKYAGSKTEQIMQAFKAYDITLLKQMAENENILVHKLTQLLGVPVNSNDNLLHLATNTANSFIKINDFLQNFPSEIINIDKHLLILKDWLNRTLNELVQLNANRNDFTLKMDQLIKALQDGNKESTMSETNTRIPTPTFIPASTILNPTLFNFRNINPSLLTAPTNIIPSRWPPFYIPWMAPINNTISMPLVTNISSIQPPQTLESVKSNESSNNQTKTLGQPQDEFSNVWQKLAFQNPNEFKQMIGFKIYPTVRQYAGDKGEKITKMLLQLENDVLVSMIDDENLLKKKIEEALLVWSD